jgi:hypothetical protein
MSTPTNEHPREGEAARWRRKLRDAEAERDALAARVESLQHRHVATLLDRENVTPEAVWAAGMTLADLLDTEGTPDPEKVTAAAATARDLLGITPGLYVPAEGRIPTAARTNQFADSFRPSKDRR